VVRAARFVLLSTLVASSLATRAAAWEFLAHGSRITTSQDQVREVVRLGDDAIVLGQGPFVEVLRVDGDTGAMLWRTTLDFRGGATMALGGDGDVFVAAASWTAYLVKLDAETGLELWRQFVGDEYGQEPVWIEALAAAPGGALIATGAVRRSDDWPETDFLVAAFDEATGAERWRYLENGRAEPPDPEALADKPSSSDAAHAVVIDGVASLVIAAGEVEHAGRPQATVVALDLGTGTVVWRHALSGSATAVVLDSAGDLVVAGSRPSDSHDEDYAVWKLAGDGSGLRWVADLTDGVLAEEDASDAVQIALDVGGDVLVSGTTVSGKSSRATVSSLVTTRLDGLTGARAWSHRLDMSGRGWPGILLHGLAVHPAGGLVLTASFPVPGPAFAAVMLDLASGQERWRHMLDCDDDQRHYRGSDVVGQSVAVMSNGDVLAAGLADFPDTNADMLWMRLSGTDGEELWRNGLVGQSAGDDEAVALATDPWGGVVAVGAVYNDDTARDLAVVSLTDHGTEVWRRELNATGDVRRPLDGAHAVAFAPDGDVVLSGSLDVQSQDSVIVAKLGAANGTERWRHVLTGSVDGAFDYPPELVVSEGGDAVVGGAIGAARRDPVTGWWREDQKAVVIGLSGDDGVENWRRTLAHPGWVAGLLGARGGDVLVAGVRSEPGSFFVERVEAMGGTSRARFEVEGASPAARPMAIGPSGEVIAVWRVRTPAGERVVVARMEPWLDVVWQRVLETSAAPISVAMDATGAITLATLERQGDVGHALDVLQLDVATGADRWHRRVADGLAWSALLAVAPSGDVVVVSATVDELRSWHPIVVGLAGSSGDERWRRTFDRAGYVHALTLDARGDVLLAGYSDVPITGRDLAVVKLRGVDGGDLPGDVTPSSEPMSSPPATSCSFPEAELPRPDPPDEKPPTPPVPDPPKKKPPTSPDPDSPDRPTPAQPPPSTPVCGAGAACDDGDPCTHDGCDSGACVHRRLPAYEYMRCRVDEGLPIPSCRSELPRRVRRALVRLGRRVERTEESSGTRWSARRLLRVARACREIQERLARAAIRMGSDSEECLVAPQRVLDDLCPDGRLPPS
jgi:outer membrane protein assembly factor BamB